MLLYNKVKEYLLEEIEKQKEGSILPSQSFLMRKLNVCHLTVRRALEELEKEGLIIKKQGKGTFVRKRIKTDYKTGILVVVPFDWKNDCCNVVPFMEKLVYEALNRDIYINIFPIGGKNCEVLRFVESQRFGGVIWLMPWEKDLPLMEEIYEKGCHVMVINRILSDSKFSYISTDHETPAYNATKYLIEKSHKRIGFVGYIETGYMIQRYKGYCRALFESGMSTSKYGVLRLSVEDAQKNRIDGFQQDFFDMLSSYKPTAVFVAGISILKNVVLPVLRKKGLKIPQDLEIITFDEIPDDVPEKDVIHEIVQPFYEMAKMSIEKMEKIIDKQYPAIQIVLQPQLLIKEDKKSFLITAEQQKGGE